MALDQSAQLEVVEALKAGETSSSITQTRLLRTRANRRLPRRRHSESISKAAPCRRRAADPDASRPDQFLDRDPPSGPWAGCRTGPRERRSGLRSALRTRNGSDSARGAPVVAEVLGSDWHLVPMELDAGPWRRLLVQVVDNAERPICICSPPTATGGSSSWPSATRFAGTPG